MLQKVFIAHFDMIWEGCALYLHHIRNYKNGHKLQHTEQHKKHGIFITSVSRSLIGPLWIVKLNLVDNP